MEEMMTQVKPVKAPIWKSKGPSLLLVNPKHFDRQAVIELKRICYDTPYPDPRGINERDPVRHADLLLRDFHSNKMVTWVWPPELLPPREERVVAGSGGKESAMMFDPLDDRQPLRFQWAPHQKFILFNFKRLGMSGSGIDTRNPIKREFLLDKWKQFVNVTEPDFAIFDDYEYCIAPRAGQDLRQYAWGAAVYGPGLVERIGKSRFMDIKRHGRAYHVEELPYGGIYVQACEDPFRPDFIELAFMAMYLHLDFEFVRRYEDDEDSA